MTLTAVVHGPRLQDYNPSDDAGRPLRRELGIELMDAYGLRDHPAAARVDPPPADDVDVERVHAPAYVRAVRRLSDAPVLAAAPEAAQWGLQPGGDTPARAGMHEAALAVCGAGLAAADLVWEGRAERAFCPAPAGLHHARAAQASGFCIYNDCALAIQRLLDAGAERVAYVDIDAHHGDGVQTAFYHDKDVMTISTHESGRWLFPGTGDVSELGEGDGRGYSVNLPLFPYTDDDVFLEVFEAVVPPLVKAFGPDVIATQLGADAYVDDPLTHLALTARGYTAAVVRLGALGYPWLAFGGGGYDLDAVPRCWTLALGTMAGRDLPDELPPGSERFLTSSRLREGDSGVDDATRSRARQWAQDQVTEIQRLIFPLHGIGQRSGS